MLKFRCQHCGQRIAVGARHLGKLVTCPECGEPTHPLAEQIVSLQSAGRRVADRPDWVRSGPYVPVSGVIADRPEISRKRPGKRSAEEVCANCAQFFGRLQQRCSWQGHPVCATCHAKLAGDSVAAEHAAMLSRVDLKSLPLVSAHPPDGGDAGSPIRKVATRRLPPPENERSLPSALARKAQGAGRLALMVGMGTLASARGAALARPNPRAIDDPSRPGGELQLAGPSLQGRLLIALAIVSLTGAAMYCMLSVLTNLAGYLSATAFILLIVVGCCLLLKGWLATSRRLFLRSHSRSGHGTAAAKAAA